MSNLIKLSTALAIIFTFFSCSEAEILETEVSQEQNSIENSLPELPYELSCNNILIDASHGGGVWWFPQSAEIGFSAENYHQGKDLADYLRGGFRVDELPRGVTISNTILNKYQTIIRTSGFTSYTESELQAYRKALQRGITLLLFTDHKRYDPK